MKRTDEIIERVAQLQGITPQDIYGKCRKRRFSDARKIVCYLLIREYNATTLEIAELLNCNHAAVLYNYNKVQWWMCMPHINPNGTRIINQITKEINNDE